jgi:hypothetical protein
VSDAPFDRLPMTRSGGARVTPDLAEYLLGRWDVERTMSEGGDEGGFAGVAEFSRAADADRLTWDEHGRMRWRGNDLEARRRLELVREGAAWEVRFDDGRPFHPLDLSTGVCSAVHPCGEDHYEGEYRVVDDDAFEVAWRVRGPRKDQRILSRYRRL